MKALLFTLSMIVTISASASNAFCMKKYISSLGINSSKGNYALSMNELNKAAKNTNTLPNENSVFRRK